MSKRKRAEKLIGKRIKLHSGLNNVVSVLGVEIGEGHKYSKGYCDCLCFRVKFDDCDESQLISVRGRIRYEVVE